MVKMVKAMVVWVCTWTFLFPPQPAEGASSKTVEATLNGLRITFDADSGSIIGLEYPGPGKMLETTPEYAGLVDLAYPIPKFEPLRLASRYSKGAKIDKSDGHVTITWDKLGASRPFDLPGKVTVSVRMGALPDGKSILLKCNIDNQSPQAVRQVLFPDLIGLIPFAGNKWTELRSGGFMMRPFMTPAAKLHSGFYVGGDREYTSGRAYQGMIMRWLDFGSLKGGISVFPRLWGADQETKVRLHRTETHKTLRISWLHDVISIDPGKQWESQEYVLTPHKYGWAKGIEPYRKWVRQNLRRIAPVPEHVRKGLGFRTIWACKGYPADGDRDVAFKFEDFQKVAQEAKDHGLDEMVVWFWHPHFQLPAPPPYEHLGTKEELAEAIKACRQIGVNVSLFVSWLSVADPTASRYGLKLDEVERGWDYHPEMVPQFRPRYASGRKTVMVMPSEHEQWRKDVLDSTRLLIKDYSASICWDQGMKKVPCRLFEEIRRRLHQDNPKATLSAETTDAFEEHAKYLDYTWLWALYRSRGDTRAYASVYHAPRLNIGINRLIEPILYSLMDNLYLNVMPSRPDDANGTAYIEEYPEVSRTLKRCAKLRAQFINYFIDGTQIGDNVLVEPTDEVYVSAYALPDRFLILVLDIKGNKPFDLKCDLQPWLGSQSGNYEIQSYDMDGAMGAKQVTAHRCIIEGTLKKHELAVFECITQ